MTEEIKKAIEHEAEEYVKRQGSHDNPDITKHDFVQGYIAALSSFPSSLKPIEGGLRWVKVPGNFPNDPNEKVFRRKKGSIYEYIQTEEFHDEYLTFNGEDIFYTDIEWLSESPNNTGEWIRCDNKLPDSEGRYLCGYKSVSSINDFPFIQFVSNFLFYRDRESGKRCERETNETGCFQDDNGYASAVTHWQPLPEPPKQ